MRLMRFACSIDSAGRVLAERLPNLGVARARRVSGERPDRLQSLRAGNFVDPPRRFRVDPVDAVNFVPALSNCRLQGVTDIHASSFRREGSESCPIRPRRVDRRRPREFARRGRLMETRLRGETTRGDVNTRTRHVQASFGRIEGFQCGGVPARAFKPPEEFLRLLDLVFR
jgi:hypothetical protein